MTFEHTNIMKNALIIYYSLSGHTAVLAEALARESGWTLARIEDPWKRTGALGYLRSSLAAILRLKPNIQYTGPQPSSFDLVVLGGPVWVGMMASPLLTFAVNHQQTFKSLALFCTYGGHGSDHAMQALARACGKPPIATLAVTQAQLSAGTYASAMTTFITTLQKP